MQLNVESVDGVTVVRLVGEHLDASNSGDFKAEAMPVLAGQRQVVLDLSAVEFVDSSGLGAILSCLRMLNAHQGDLKLCGMAKPVRVLFELVRMHRIFDIFETLDEAIASFRR